MEKTHNKLFALVAFTILATVTLSSDAYADSITKSPTIADSSPAVNDFVNPQDAFSSDNLYATADNGDEQAYGGFGFTIPTGAQINGIILSIEGNRYQCPDDDKPRFTAQLSTPGLTDSEINVLSDFTSIIKQTSDYDSADETKTLGSSTDTWGLNYSPEQLDSLYVLISPECDWPKTELKLDQLQVTINYTLEDEEEPCDPGLTLVDDQCVPERQCDIGYTLVDDQCVPIDPPQGTGDDDFRLSGSCSDCTPPTLGYNDKGQKMVDGGFTYNGLTSDANYFFTPYPLITTSVGIENVAELKIFENEGPEQIRHVALAFGLAKGDYISQSKAVIVYDVDFLGNAKLSQIDPEDAIDDDTLRVEIEMVRCMESSTDEKCLLLRVYHTFRAPLDFDMVGTDLWDDSKNSWQNFFNHGVNIQGETVNDLSIQRVLDKRGLVHLVQQVDKTLKDKARVVDVTSGKLGNLVNGVFVLDKEPVIKASKSDKNREGTAFQEIKIQQASSALSFAKSKYSKTYDKPYKEIDNIFVYDFKPRMDDRLLETLLN